MTVKHDDEEDRRLGRESPPPCAAPVWDVEADADGEDATAERAAPVDGLQFVQRVHDEEGGPDRWEAVSIDNPARRVIRDTFDEAVRALAAAPGVDS